MLHMSCFTILFNLICTQQSNMEFNQLNYNKIINKIKRIWNSTLIKSSSGGAISRRLPPDMIFLLHSTLPLHLRLSL